jgi:DNA-binding transcriptional MerR regulator
MEAVKAMKLLSTKEVSDLTGVPENTLRYYKHKGLGPKCGKLGSRVIYREQDVVDWVNAAFEVEATA